VLQSMDDWSNVPDNDKIACQYHPDHEHAFCTWTQTDLTIYPLLVVQYTVV